MSLILIRKTEKFAAVLCDERMRTEDRNGNLIKIQDGYNKKLLILRPDLVLCMAGIQAPSEMLRHRLLKFFHENCSDPDLFERLRDKITTELKSLFASFSAKDSNGDTVLSKVHLSEKFAVVMLVGVDKQKIRCVSWDSASVPDFSAVEYDDDWLCMGGDKAGSEAQLLLSMSNPYLGPSESLTELEWVAQKVATKFPDYVSPSGFSFLIHPKQSRERQVSEDEK